MISISTIAVVVAIVSISLNLFLFWYCRKLINFINLTTSDMESLYGSIDSYKEHLTRVYGLETFYGDQTLQSLLEHTRRLGDDVGDFVEINQQLLYGDEDA